MNYLSFDVGIKNLAYCILTPEKKIINWYEINKRDLPWRQSSDEDRKSSEDVRPIFWSNRPVSYLARTENWDDFPNGRWGDISSPTFGELNQYHAIRAGSKSDVVRNKRKKIWGNPESIADVSNVFFSYPIFLYQVLLMFLFLFAKERLMLFLGVSQN